MATPTPPRLPVGERLRRAGVAAWSIIGILIVLAVFVWLFLKIRIIFPPLVLALLIIYLVNPIVTRFERRGVRRSVAAVLSYMLVIGTLTLLGFGVAPFVSSQVSEFVERWPDFKEDLVDSVRDLSGQLEDRTGIALPANQVACLVGVERPDDPGAATQTQCDQLTTQFRESLGVTAGRVTEVGLSVLEGVLVFILAPLIALYLLIDLPQIQRDLLNLVPESHRDEATDLSTKIGRAVGGFFRGQLFVAFTVGVLSAIGFRIIGLPFWLPIGAIAGFFNLIPLVGPFIGGTIGFLVGTITGGIGLGISAAVVEVIVQQLDNHLISPTVMSRTVKVHPAAVMLSLLAGGAIAGFWGVLLAVPGVAVLKLLAAHFWSTRVLGAQVSPHAPEGREPRSSALVTEAPGGDADAAGGARREPERP